VLGELFGVTRQFAGELMASSEKEVTFYQFNERPEVLKYIGSKKVHNLEDFESLWISYFDQIVAGSEIVKFKAPITLPNGNNIEGDVTRYGLFNASYDDNILEPKPSQLISIACKPA
jgi:biopolymer transport protein ExbB